MLETAVGAPTPSCNPEKQVKKLSLRSGLLATTTICGAALSTMAGGALVATVATMLPTVAQAQDYTSGTLLGSVKDDAGTPIAGAKVVVTSLSQGVTRETTTDSKGAFQFALIPIGNYSVTISAPNYSTTTDDHVSVVLGSQSGFDFTLAASDDTVVIVKAKARPRLDFAATTTGVVVDVETLTKQTPIARNVTALVMLAPSAVPGDSGFGAGATAQGLTQASVSGASVGENVFYINGLNITNFVNGIGAAGVPFDFYKTIEVKTGGYQAEYGRGTGGVISAVTKSGTNSWNFALHGNYQPEDMRSHSPDTVTGNVTGQVGDRTTVDLSEYTFEAGGPLIKDKLFFYGLYSAPNYKSTTATSQGSTYQETRYNDPVWGVKLDGYITSKHHFELTAFDTTQQRESTQYNYAPATDTIGAYKITGIQNFGGASYVGRYTGNITNWLTVSAAYGDSKFTQSNYNNLIDEPFVSDTRSGSARTISRQSSSAFNVPSDAERKFYRADADLYFNLLGKHHVRVGIDHEETTFTNISSRNGGQNWTYRKAAAGNSLGLLEGQEYVQLRTFNGGGAFEGLNEAQYIQDSWDINSQLNINIGYRSDDFTVKDADGNAFSEEKGNKGWRAGFSFDPTGEKKDKIFGFYGRYYLPVASNTAYRAASNNLDVTQSFLPVGGGLTFGALDAVTGKPVAGLGDILVRGVNSTAGALAACKQLFLDRGIVAVPVGTLACQVGSGGVAPAPESISALNVKSSAEDEYILGYERRINSLWKVGATLTYRKLLTSSDDMAIDAAVIALCEKEGITGCKDIWTGTHQYLIANPGADVVAVLSDPLPGETEARTVTLSAADLGFPKAERTYKALELTFTRAFDGKWGLQGSYVLSESKGNTEGAVKSDTGQADAGITSDNDLIGFTDGAYGLLPNHHAHQIKLWGSYQFNENLLFGFNYSGISGRRYGCNGPVPISRDPDQISTFYNPPPGHYCFGELVTRGTAFQTDWINRLDISARYQVPSEYISLVNNSNLVLRADIFNLFDLKGVQEAVETGQLSSGAANADYKKPVAYQAPRYVRLGFDLTF
jgi:hypothetical protein